VGPVAIAAEYAVRDPGTEVSATEIAGQSRGPRGRWAVLLRRPHRAVPDRQDEVPVATDAAPIDGIDGVNGGEGVVSVDGIATTIESESKATPADPAPRHTIEAD
jgi:hypothetical protein